MSKYDEFDLDIRHDADATNDGARSDPALTVNIIVCTITLSFNYCGPLSESLDCGSQNHDCSGSVWSKCNACGSSAVRAARC